MWEEGEAGGGVRGVGGSMLLHTFLVKIIYVKNFNKEERKRKRKKKEKKERHLLQ